MLPGGAAVSPEMGTGTGPEDLRRCSQWPQGPREMSTGASSRDPPAPCRLHTGSGAFTPADARPLLPAGPWVQLQTSGPLGAGKRTGPLRGASTGWEASTPKERRAAGHQEGASACLSGSWIHFLSQMRPPLGITYSHSRPSRWNARPRCSIKPLFSMTLAKDQRRGLMSVSLGSSPGA